MPTYFTLKELCGTSHKEIDNFPTFEVAAHLEELVVSILDPLRIAWNGAIIVNSGYRCEELNKAVGGVATSAHKIGYAADIRPANGKIEEFISFAKAFVKASRLRFDQFIRETNPKSGAVWLHIGLYSPSGTQRGQFLDIVKK